MTEAVRFLNAFAQALATMALYPDEHPACQSAIETAYANLQALQALDRRLTFSFLGDEVIFGQRPLRELRGWDWSGRLAGAGVQRVEFESETTREEFENFLSQVLARITLSAIQQPSAQEGSVGSIRFGTVGLGEQAPQPELVTATIAMVLKEEAETVEWLHEEMRAGGGLPLAEAEAVARSLSLAMHGDQAVVLPLLQLRRYDEYTTTHSLNVCVLTMGLAEWVGLGARDVRAFGVAGLLHDVGKIKVPTEILNKAGRLTTEEREIMNQHPVEGAKLILESEEKLDLAAVVAYEHHIMQNGGGYPKLDYPRECHRASRLAHVCDVYDALRTTRPYRGAWPAGKVLAYVEERAGSEFDPEVASAFVKMMGEWEPKRAELEAAAADSPVPAVPAAPAAPAAPVAGSAGPQG